MQLPLCTKGEHSHYHGMIKVATLSQKWFSFHKRFTYVHETKTSLLLYTVCTLNTHIEHYLPNSREKCVAEEVE